MWIKNALQHRITFITAEFPIGNSRLFGIFGFTRKSTMCFPVTKRYTTRCNTFAKGEL